MTAAYPLTPLINSLAIDQQQAPLAGYYRSKLFTIPCSANTLLSAASPLFSLTGRLGISQTLPPLTQIRESLEHEMYAFQSKLSAANYSAEQMSLARYLLCATLDELLAKSYLRLYEEPIHFQAFTPSCNDGVGPEYRFFEIVQYIREKPHQYLDIIELAYCCLIAGYEGAEHLNANGRQTLDNLIEDLYLMIQQYRVNKPQKLFNDATLQAAPAKKSWLPTILTIVSCVILIGGMFFTSYLLMENQAKNLLQHHTQLVVEDD